MDSVRILFQCRYPGGQPSRGSALVPSFFGWAGPRLNPPCPKGPAGGARQNGFPGDNARSAHDALGREGRLQAGRPPRGRIRARSRKRAMQTASISSHQSSHDHPDGGYRCVRMCQPQVRQMAAPSGTSSHGRPGDPVPPNREWLRRILSPPSVFWSASSKTAPRPLLHRRHCGPDATTRAAQINGLHIYQTNRGWLAGEAREERGTKEPPPQALSPRPGCQTHFQLFSVVQGRPAPRCK